jgi:two-component sensor histidine kinase
MKVFIRAIMASIWLCASSVYALGGTVPDKAIVARTKKLLDNATAVLENPMCTGKDALKSIDMIQQAEKLALANKDVGSLALCYVNYIQAYCKSNQRAKALSYYNKALPLLKGKRIEDGGNVHLHLAFYYYNADKDHDKRVVLMQKAIDYFTSHKFFKKAGETSELLAEQYCYMVEDDKAIPVLEQAIVYYNRAGYRQLQRLYDMLGDCYTFLHRDDLGLKYGITAARLAEKYKDSVLLPTICTSMSLKYFNIKEPQKALEYCEKGIPIAEKNSDTLNIFYLYGNSVAALTELKRYDEGLKRLDHLFKHYTFSDKNIWLATHCDYIDLYLGKKQPKKALAYLQKIQQIIPSGDNEHAGNYFYAYKAFINTYIANKQYDKAKYYLKLYKKMSVDDSMDSEIFVYYWQYQLDSVAGNYAGALKNFHAFQDQKNKRYSQAKSMQFAEQATIYETEKKDHEIQLLSKDAQLQRQGVKQARLERNLAYGLGLFIIVGSVVIFIFYRKKVRITRILNRQQGIINHKNTILSRLVEEKEFLLREIHHRVKNNLQIVISLLNSQSEYLDDPSAQKAISDSQRRVYSMSLIHQKLYQNDNLSVINMESYIKELVYFLKDSFDAEHIHFSIKVACIDFDVSQAVPVGLILNEAITNALKYAFKDSGVQPVIEISLQETEPGLYTLVIRDNGKGLPDGFDVEQTASLGMTLLKGLSSELDGDFEIFTDNGVVVQITFSQCITNKAVG